MKTRNYLFLSALCALMSFSFVACDDDDDNKQEGVPTSVVTDVKFTDTDKNASKIAGTVSWTAPSSVEDITKYVIYLSSDGEGKDTKLGEVEVGTNSYTIQENTDFTSYILVIAANLKGESNAIAKVQVTDLTEEPVPVIPGVYIMNSGKWQSNNATLDYYDPNTKELKTKVFASVNGRGLGDTANDIMVYGSKMYITVSESNTVEITDLNAKSLKTLAPKDDSGQPQSPRYLAAYAGKVYVTLFDGHLAEIDTTSMEITQKTKVGPNPYQVREVGGKLYVANSGGYNPVQDSTLSVVDPVSFKEEKKIVVGLNPMYMGADSDGEMYVVCGGNFGDVKASLQRVDLKAETSTSIYTDDNILMGMAADKLYVIHSQNDANWQPVNTQFVSYDTKSDTETSKNFITDGTVVEKAYSLNVNPSNGDIYIGTSDYTSTGDMFIFSAEGKKLNQLEVSGINPMGVGFLK